MLTLRVHRYGAAAWRLYSADDLADAIAEFAGQVASDAGSDLLAEGTEEEREQLRASIVERATLALRHAGDEYIAPDGIRYSLEEERDCPGHPAGPFDPVGVTTYCDGSCS